MRAQTGAVKQLDLEGEVREAVQQSHHTQVQPLEFVPRTFLAPPVPDYVSHREDVSEIGRLSAEAIVMKRDSARMRGRGIAWPLISSQRNPRSSGHPSTPGPRS